MLLATVSTEAIRAWAIPAASQDAVVGDVAEHSWMLEVPEPSWVAVDHDNGFPSELTS
jgi:hypothetical protein